MNGSVSLAVSISRENLAAVILSFVGCACVGCVQVSVARKGDYFMFDNSHYLNTRAETVSTLRLHPRLILGKTYAAQAFEELYNGKLHQTGLK